MLGPALSSGARLVGATLALYIASDQTYDRTQVFATGAAAFALTSIVPAPPAARVTLAALASGLLFFAGALLLDQTAGIGMLVSGAIAITGLLIVNHRAGGSPAAPIGGFFFGLGLTIVWLAVVVLTVEG
jgi:hypothetical protein